MANIDINVEFSPQKLRAFSRNEAQMTMIFKNLTGSTYWCECEIIVASPLSLSHDSEMNSGKTRVGILKPMGNLKKQIKLYTRPNNYPDDYMFSIVGYIYDEDGAISERFEKKLDIPCVSEEQAKSIQDK